MGDGKYGKQKRRQTLRDARAAQDALENPERWWPDRDKGSEESTETSQEDEWRVTQRTVTYPGTNVMIEFAVTFSVRDGEDRWREVLSIDTCNHQSVHRHRNGDHSVFEDIAFISDQEVIQEHYWEAVGEAYDLAYGEG